jgi:hypothetical protein
LRGQKLRKGATNINGVQQLFFSIAFRLGLHAVFGDTDSKFAAKADLKKLHDLRLLDFAFVQIYFRNFENSYFEGFYSRSSRLLLNQFLDGPTSVSRCHYR